MYLVFFLIISHMVIMSQKCALQSLPQDLLTCKAFSYKDYEVERQLTMPKSFFFFLASHNFQNYQQKQFQFYLIGLGKIFVEEVVYIICPSRALSFIFWVASLKECTVGKIGLYGLTQEPGKKHRQFSFKNVQHVHKFSAFCNTFNTKIGSPAFPIARKENLWNLLSVQKNGCQLLSPRLCCMCGRFCFQTKQYCDL